MVSILFFTVPLVLVALLGLAGIRLTGPSRRMGILVLTVTLGCILIDAGLLLALPRLGLSFGPVGLPLFLASTLRLGLIVPGLAYLAIRRPAAPRVATLVAATMIIFQAGLLAAEVDGLYVEPFRLGVTRLPVSAPAFLPDRRLRILQISDLHVERITPRERQMLADVDALQPDLIVLTGDYINEDYMGDARAMQDARQVMSRLHAPYGVYAVIGTVDHPEIMAAVFTGLDIHVLDDRVEPVSLPGGSLYLLGVTDTDDWDRDRTMLSSLMKTIPPDAYSLLLYHSPDLIEAASVSGVDLALAGHTHGGQVRLPFYGAVITFSRFGKKYEMGRYQVGATTLYVSRGIGMEGLNLPRARFLCPPELVLVELGK
jgi:predicted MPP superfamily phosphohydrolase